MVNEANLTLSDSELDAVRRLGGIAYMGVVFGRGARGRRYRPVRTQVYRTEEAAQRELDKLRFHPSVIVTRREVVLVEAKREQVV